MRPSTPAIVMTTVGTRAAARRLSDRILEARLAACIQALPIRSTYRWKGRVERPAELLLLVKTRPALVRPLCALIRRHHPYEVPEILALRAAGALPAYARWIEAETRPR